MNWPYIAGFFDGEGSVVVHRGQHGAFRVQIVQSEKNGGKQLLEEIAAFLFSDGIHSKVYHASKHRKCPMFVLHVGQCRSIKKFLSSVFPYLRVKRSLAQDVIRYISLYPSYRDAGVHRGFEIHNRPRPWVSANMKGKRYAATKLTMELAAQIMAMKGQGLLQREIAKQFGISRPMVEMIWLGKRWKLD